MPRQVRLDDDVVAALSRLVDAQGEGSISSHANRRLRQALGLATPTTRDGAARPTAATVSSAAGRPRRRGGDVAALRARLGAS